MLYLIRNYHLRLINEAQSAGPFRLPVMAMRMLLCELLIVAVAVTVSISGLGYGARFVLVLPVGSLCFAMILHLAYVFTEAFDRVPVQQP